MGVVRVDVNEELTFLGKFKKKIFEPKTLSMYLNKEKEKKKKKKIDRAGI